MKKALCFLVIVGVFFSGCAIVHAQSNVAVYSSNGPMYLFPDGKRCKGKREPAGPLAFIAEESGTEKTLVAITVWNGERYKTSLYLIDGDEMVPLQGVRSEEECASIYSDALPSADVVSEEFGIHLTPSQSLGFQGPGGEILPVLYFR